MPQWRSKILSAAAKTWLSHINRWILKKNGAGYFLNLLWLESKNTTGVSVSKIMMMMMPPRQFRDSSENLNNQADRKIGSQGYSQVFSKESGLVFVPGSWFYLTLLSTPTLAGERLWRPPHQSLSPWPAGKCHTGETDILQPPSFLWVEWLVPNSNPRQPHWHLPRS